MNVMDDRTAKLSGYRSITINVNPNTEQGIMESMEKTLKGCDACWIIFTRSHYEAARKASHLSKSVKD